MILVVAEKPRVAADIARVLGAVQRQNGCYKGRGIRVTWAIGHLVSFASPEEMNEAWGAWSFENLPMFPEAYRLVVREGMDSQFEIVKGLMNDVHTTEIVAATDAGREGELIFRYIYELAECNKPVQRLWTRSLTPEAITKGFQTLRSAEEYRNLASAATARSRADWLVGMNLSRFYTLRARSSGSLISIGRVQTPTLAIVVERDAHIRAFKPECYQEVHGRFATAGVDTITAIYKRNMDHEGKTLLQAKLPSESEDPGFGPRSARAVLALAKSGAAFIESRIKNRKLTPPPHLFDLTCLQQEANQRFNFTAAKTLDLAQELYEKHKAITYPRTNCKYLPSDLSAQLPKIALKLSKKFSILRSVDPSVFRRPLDRRFMDDERISDHHAIIPTGILPKARDPAFARGSDKEKLFHLIAQRFLCAFLPAVQQWVTEVVFAVKKEHTTHRYFARGSETVFHGWQLLDPPSKSKKSGQRLPAGLSEGKSAVCEDAFTVQKETTPPLPFTEATLLRAMESAGKRSSTATCERIQDCGIGTPATRAAVLETLFRREYLVRDGNQVRSTERGHEVVQQVDPELRDPGMTSEWERRLRKIEQGEESLEEFTRDVEGYIRKIVSNRA
ncbi:MAG: DNA topoisomerase 3 [Myxococcota bacterium]